MRKRLFSLSKLVVNNFPSTERFNFEGVGGLQEGRVVQRAIIIY